MLRVFRNGYGMFSNQGANSPIEGKVAYCNRHILLFREDGEVDDRDVWCRNPERHPSQFPIERGNNLKKIKSKEENETLLRLTSEK